MEHSRISAKSTLTSKGQTTVPKEVREALRMVDGAQIEWVVEEGGQTAIVKPRTRRAVDLAGFLGPSPIGPVTIEEMNEAIGDAPVARFERAVKR